MGKHDSGQTSGSAKSGHGGAHGAGTSKDRTNSGDLLKGAQEARKGK